MATQKTLKIGKMVNLGGRILSSHHVIYCGINNNSFSLAYLQSGSSFANLFFPIDMKDIELGSMKIKILEVHTHKLIVEI